MKVLRTRIVEYRRANDVTQGELAEKVDVRRETIARLERGMYNPSLKLAYDVAQFFGVSIEDVFSYIEVDEGSTGGENVSGNRNTAKNRRGAY